MGIEHFNKDSLDPTRKRSWCIFYETPGNQCKGWYNHCIGATHCDHYKSNHTLVQDKAQKKLPPHNIAKPFTGLKSIRIEEISLAGKSFVAPSEDHLRVVREHHRHFNELDLPIVVSVKDGRYVLEDRYLRYYFAKKSGIKTIWARMGTYHDNAPDDRIRQIGQIVKHKSYGVGQVMDVRLRQVTVYFDSGSAITFEITPDLLTKTLILIDEQ